MYKINVIISNTVLKKQTLYSVTVGASNLFSKHLCSGNGHSGLNIWNEELEQSTKHRIEEYWKDKLQHKEFTHEDSKQKCYVLSMFPYPSGNLHMGHVRVYTISDTMARFYKMNGKNVLHPMGWDAFGLPAENAAIERGIPASKWTHDNIQTMKEQLKQLGCGFDWDRELATCQPEYYRFTQEIFLRMYDEGLVYRKEALVNWDPVDQTVLADEQVDDNGCSWRSGAKVEKKVLKQWFIRTTQFAKKLYNGLDDPNLQDWRDIIKLQKHWIGECNGASFDVKLVGSDIEEKSLNVWTSRPEHIDKVKFVAAAYGSVLDRKFKGEKDRKLNVEVINPLTEESLPVFVTNRVEYDLGRDYRLGIPSLFESDADFAESINIPFDKNVDVQEDLNKRTLVVKQLNGLECSSKIRDWLISRQRYWGTPIPMVHCEQCGPQPVPYDKLPVTLPTVDTLTEKGVIYSAEQMSTTCPKCGGHAEKESDTMDTFVDSSWYFLRYIDPKNKTEPFSKELAAKLMPVDIYIGGKEHAVLHLYYARFVTYFLHHIGWLPYPEPFTRLLVQGMVMGKSFRVKGTGRYLTQDEIDFSGKKPVEAKTGKALVESWEKMSKSKHNGVEPSKVIREYGIDMTRLLILADVAPFSNRNWNKNTFPGIINWQKRLWFIVKAFREARSENLSPSEDLEEKELFLWERRNFFVRLVTFNYAVSHQLSTAISKMQAFTNDLRKQTAPTIAHSCEYERALMALVIMLTPIAPYFASQLWSGIATVPGRLDKHWSKSVVEQHWPQIDPTYKVPINCLVNKSLKCTVKVPFQELNNMSQEDAINIALKQPEVQVYTNSSPVLDVHFKLQFGLEANLNMVIGPKKLELKAEGQN